MYHSWPTHQDFWSMCYSARAAPKSANQLEKIQKACFSSKIILPLLHNICFEKLPHQKVKILTHTKQHNSPKNLLYEIFSHVKRVQKNFKLIKLMRISLFNRQKVLYSLLKCHELLRSIDGAGRQCKWTFFLISVTVAHRCSHTKTCRKPKFGWCLVASV